MSIQFRDFKKDFVISRDEPAVAQAESEALAALNRWRHENQTAQVIVIETLVSDHGSSMTSVGGRKFIAFRLWYESPTATAAA